MPTQVAFQPDALGGTTSVFTVPGDQQWTVRSVCAVVTTVAGGTPNRYYSLQISDGTNVLATIPASDGSADPASGTVTWCDAPAASIATAASFASNAALPRVVLLPGYTLTVFVNNAVIGDSIDALACWYDYAVTNPGA